MTTVQQSNPIDELEKSFQAAIAYYQGPGTTSTARVGDWGPKETLAHFIYFCNRNIQGMQEATRGGGPVPIFESPFTNVDDLSAAKVAQYADNSMAEVIAAARQAHERMIQEARAMSDLDVPIILRPDGETQSARVRIENTSRHWLNHIDQLKNA